MFINGLSVSFSGITEAKNNKGTFLSTCHVPSTVLSTKDSEKKGTTLEKVQLQRERQIIQGISKI